MEFLRCLSSRALKGLHVDNSYNSGQDFADFVAVAQQYLNPESLLHFDVQCRLGITPPPGPTKLSPETLLPLFAFRNLESMIILLNQDLGLLDDVHLRRICDAFPRLRILDLAGLEYATSVSTKGVMSAIQRLPSLEFFGLRFPLELTLKEATAYRFPRLATLATRGSPLVDVATTADFICSVFPSLRFIVVGAKPFEYVRDEDDTGEEMVTHFKPCFDQWIDVVRHMQDLGCRYKVVARESVEVHPLRFNGYDPQILPI
jgi:hypothetical protein